MKSAAPPSRLRRNLSIAAVVLFLFTIVGFFIVPPILKSQLQKRLSAELGRTVTVGKVRFNPYACSLTLENLNVREKDGKTSFASWGRLYVNFDPLSSLTGHWSVGDIELDGFRVAVAIKPDGSLGFADILDKLNPPGAAPAKPGRPVRIGKLNINQAFVEFSDHSLPNPFATVIGPLTFDVTGFHTTGGDKGAPYHFHAATESGEKLDWSGTIGVEPFRSEGNLKLENFVVGKYSPYQARLLRADVTKGKLSINGHYEFDFSNDHRVLKFTNGAIHLDDLKMVERDNREPVLDLQSFDLAGINVDAAALKATVDTIRLAGGQMRVRREKDGTVNWLAMIQPRAAQPTSTTTAASPDKLPDIMIGEVATKDFGVTINDLAASRPVELGLTGIALSLKKVTLADGAVMPVELSFGWAPQGTVHVEGTVAIKPGLKVDLKTGVTGLEILPLSPYVEQFINARLTQGSVTSTVAVQAEMPAGQPIALTANGDVKVEKFALVDSAHQEDLAGVGTLELKGLKVATAPKLSVALDEVNLAGPYARVIVAADKSVNLMTVAKMEPKPAAESSTPTVETPPSAQTAPAASLPRIEVGRIVISGGEFSFADRSIEPNVNLAINQFAGTITGLSSENLAKAGVDLKAAVDGAGPVAITGQLDPLGPDKFVDLKINFRNMDLLPLSPYLGKYAGFELARGKLAFDFKFLLEGKKINAHDLITLNQFTFGTATNSPEATFLPVRLGVALLKDTEGKIVIDVPIEGSTDDPSFRISKVVLRVIVNLLTKAAVSPFSLLGSMFGGGGEELAYQEFAPGGKALQPGEIKKLETMVKALTNRPALSVALEGSYDKPADTFALKREKLAQMVRRAIWDQKHAVSPAILPPEQLVISPDENAAMVKQLFDAKFPPGTEFGTPLAKAPETAAPPPPPKKGFFGKVVDVVTLKKLRAEKPKEKEPAPVEAKNADGTVIVGPSLDEMSGRLAETMEVGDNDLRALATARAQQVRDYFITVGKIDPERLFLAQGPTDPAKEPRSPTNPAKAAQGPRVFLSLQ